jgi:hypothetical protein
MDSFVRGRKWKRRVGGGQKSIGEDGKQKKGTNIRQKKGKGPEKKKKEN